MRTSFLFCLIFFSSLQGTAIEKPLAAAVFRNAKQIELNRINRFSFRADDQYFLSISDSELIPLKLIRSESQKLILGFEQTRGLRELIQSQLQLVVKSGSQTRLITHLQMAPLLDEEYYYNGPLGVTWSQGVPTFRLWAPTAQEVRLHIYESSNGLPIISENLIWKDNVWTLTGRSEWKNRYYLYEVKVYSPYQGKIVSQFVTDPYSVSLSENSEKSQVVDLDDSALKPAGWGSLRKPQFSDFSEIVIYESHLRDLTAHDSGLTEAEKGAYSSLCSVKSKARAHLMKLAQSGVSHLHLLPLSDFATVQENRSLWKTLSFSFPPVPNSAVPQEQLSLIREEDSYNWGYDPVHFMVPEGSYSQKPNGFSRILEFRQMVQSLNQMGLRLIMDVVFNHTYAAGEEPFSVLDRIVPLYYYRLNSSGQLYKSSCCPDVATEHAMVEKLINDSLLLWAKDYKVDGFRFDLMNMHTLGGMVRLKNTLRSLNLQTDGVDGKKIFLYGEAWPFGSLEEKYPGQSFQQLRSAQLGIGTFNDRLRDAARGGTTSSYQKSDQGFATGLYYRFNHEPANQDTPTDQEGQRQKLLHLADVVKIGLAGNLKEKTIRDHLNHQVKGGDLLFRKLPVGYAAEPWETINYVSAHDGTSLWDAVQAKFPFSDQNESGLNLKIRSHRLMLALVTLSQGIPFFESGSEILRSRSGDVDSYDSGDWFNALDLSLKTNGWGRGLPPSWRNSSDWSFWHPRLSRQDYQVSFSEVQKTFDYFLALLKVRKSTKLLRLGSSQSIKNLVLFPLDDRVQTDIPGLIVMKIENPGLRFDSNRESLMVFFNASTTDQIFYQQSLIGKNFLLHPDLTEKIDAELVRARFDSSQGIFIIPAQSTVVFQENQE